MRLKFTRKSAEEKLITSQIQKQIDYLKATQLPFPQEKEGTEELVPSYDMMKAALEDRHHTELEGFRKDGDYKRLNNKESAQGPGVRMEGRGAAPAHTHRYRRGKRDEQSYPARSVSHEALRRATSAGWC